MSDSSLPKPDLDDNSSVLANAAAVSREKELKATEGESAFSSLLVGGAILVTVMMAGGALFSASLFDYKNLSPDGYVRASAPSTGNEQALPKPALEAYMKAGGKLAKASCLACHGSNGEGAGAVPPLAGSEWVTGSTARTAMIILNGVKGEIEVAGRPYNGNMPSQGAGLSAKDLAGVLTYVRNSFGNEGSLVTMEMAQQAIDLSKERNSGQMTASELNEKYDKDLEGAELAPDTLVDPNTLEPVDAAE